MICSEIINKEGGWTDTCLVWLKVAGNHTFPGFWSYCSLLFASISMALVFTLFPISHGFFIYLAFGNHASIFLELFNAGLWQV